MGLSAFLGWILDAVRLKSLFEDFFESGLRFDMVFLFWVF